MKRLSLTIAAMMFGAGTALAADLPATTYTKAPVAAPAVPVFDIAMGGALASDYVFRGISQSDRRVSVSGYFEPRWNIAPDWQLYVGAYGYSLSPLFAAAEVDLYGGIRPTFGPVTLDIGFLYYAYPAPVAVAGFPSNYADLYEVYFKPIWTVNDQLSLGLNVAYSPDRMMNVPGAPALYEYYVSGTAKYVLPATLLPTPFGAYISGEFGHQAYENKGFATNVDYNFWNAGVAFTYKIVTLDLRYYDTDLSRNQCTFDSPGARRNACGSTFVAKLAFDLTLDNLK